MRPTFHLFSALIFVALMKDLEENLEIESADQSLTLEKVARIAYISQRLVDNLRKFLRHLEYLFMCAKI